MGRLHLSLEALLHGEYAKSRGIAAVRARCRHGKCQPDAFSFYGAQLMSVRRMQGRYGELVPLISDLVDQESRRATFKAFLATPKTGRRRRRRPTSLRRTAVASFLLPQDSSWATGIVPTAPSPSNSNSVMVWTRCWSSWSHFTIQIRPNGLTPADPIAMYLGGLATLLGRYDEQSLLAELRAQPRGAMPLSPRRTRIFSGAGCCVFAAARLQRTSRGLLEEARSDRS